MTNFQPVKVAVSAYPHPVGAIVRGSMGSLSTVVDRDGFVFLACCAEHESQGVASGYYVQAEGERILGRSELAGVDSYTCPHTPGGGSLG